MKLKDIIKQVNRDVEEEYEAADVVDWVNRCLDDLTPIAKREASQTFTIDATNSYALPADLHEEVVVLVNGCEYDKLPLDDRTSRGYRKWAGKLILQDGPNSGTIELLYYRNLNHMTTSDSEAEPDLETPYQDLLILYATGMLQFVEEEYDRPDALQKYAARKQDYADYIERMQPPLMMRVE